MPRSGCIGSGCPRPSPPFLFENAAMMRSHLPSCPINREHDRKLPVFSRSHPGRDPASRLRLSRTAPPVAGIITVKVCLFLLRDLLCLFIRPDRKGQAAALDLFCPEQELLPLLDIAPLGHKLDKGCDRESDILPRSVPHPVYDCRRVLPLPHGGFFLNLNAVCQKAPHRCILIGKTAQITVSFLPASICKLLAGQHKGIPLRLDLLGKAMDHIVPVVGRFRTCHQCNQNAVLQINDGIQICGTQNICQCPNSCA